LIPRKTARELQLHRVSRHTFWVHSGVRDSEWADISSERQLTCQPEPIPTATLRDLLRHAFRPAKPNPNFYKMRLEAFFSGNVNAKILVPGCVFFTIWIK
jgi:hypothetical protein